MDYTIAANNTSIGAGDAAPVGGTPGEFTSGNAAQGVAATVLPAYQMNAIVQEIIGVISAAGITPDRTNTAQLAQAVSKIANPGKVAGIAQLSAATALTAAQSGYLVELSGASSYTVTLPAASAAATIQYLIWNNSAVGMTITASGGTFQGSTGGGANSITLPAGDVVTLISDGTNWVMFADVMKGDFGASLATSGWQILPSGRMEVWDSVTIPNGSNVEQLAIVFPKAFSVGCLNVVANGTARANSVYNPVACMPLLSTFTTTGFTMVFDTTSSNQSFATGVTANYRAIGH